MSLLISIRNDRSHMQTLKITTLYTKQLHYPIDGTLGNIRGTSYIGDGQACQVNSRACLKQRKETQQNLCESCSQITNAELKLNQNLSLKWESYNSQLFSTEINLNQFLNFDSAKWYINGQIPNLKHIHNFTNTL